MKKVLLFCSILMATYVNSQNVGLNFDGVDDYVQSNFSGITGSNPRTVEAWIKTTANCNPSAGGAQNVITDWGSTVTGGRFTFNVLYSNALRLEVQGNGLGGHIPVNDGVWHHVAVTFDPTATNQISLYVDGVLDTAGNVTVPVNTTAATNFLIGKRVDNVKFFAGSIDEVRVYNFAKTMTQINADKGKEFCAMPTGLVAYYKLNDGVANATNTANTNAKDYSTGANNGTLNNFALTGTTSNWITGPVLTGGNSTKTLPVSACNTYTSPSGLHTWTASGTYMDTIANAAGCDSIITINLTLGSSTSSITKAACATYTSPAGHVHTTSGTYMDTLLHAGVSGCDSIITIHLTVGIPHAVISASGCNTYTSPAGHIHTSSSTFIDTLVGASAIGCDSIITINLVIGSSLSSQTKVACDSFISIKNKVYKTTGIYNDTLTGASSLGCDSIVVTHLTINNSKATTQSLAACDSVKIGSTWYKSSQTVPLHLSTSNGCDSLISFILTINHSSSATQTKTACDSFVSPKGLKYLASGIYTEHYTSAKGCDSAIVYNLTIIHGATSTRNFSACDSAFLGGRWYKSSQTVKIHYTAANGCDSLESIVLTINHLNLTVVLSGNSLVAAQAGGTYSWYNCNTHAVVAGQTSATFSPTIAGSYAAIITANGCTDTSSCTSMNVGIENISAFVNTKIIPNPNRGKFTIQMDENVISSRVSIIDLLGKVVLDKETNGATKIEIQENLSSGIYLMQIESNLGLVTKKMIIE